MKLVQKNGLMLVRRIFRRNKDGANLPKLLGHKAGERTVELGPFTLDEVHAMVGTEARVTISENYHTVALGVFVNIPVAANDDAVREGLEYCRDTANSWLNQEMKGARQLLRNMAGR